jgi:hypothetical protein
MSTAASTRRNVATDGGRPRTPNARGAVAAHCAVHEDAPAITGCNAGSNTDWETVVTTQAMTWIRNYLQRLDQAERVDRRQRPRGAPQQKSTRTGKMQTAGMGHLAGSTA